MKARWLGLDKLRRSDVYAPVSTDSKEIPFADGVALTLNSFAGFDSEISQMARRVLDERHMDSEVRPGKRSGAFCATVQPDLTPWVLLSYQERPDDVATLAHELGHAIHSMLAAGHSQLTHQATLPLAETASTFAEMLLVDEMLAEDDDPAIQQSLLFMQMDDAYATIARQAGFALFEKAAHKAIRAGASVDDLSALYLDMLKEELGDSVEVGDEFKYEWLAIPHIYSVPFYVYAYAFGQLLVLSLYQQYQEEGESFKPRYRRILAAGGSDSPENILTAAGIDMTDSDFWQGGFDVVDKMLSRLEELPVPTS
jgi:oligoendopeptidase F